MRKRKIEYFMAAPKGAAIRFCRGILAMFLLITLLSTAVFADSVWDGYGTTDDANVNTVTGGYSIALCL